MPVAKLDEQDIKNLVQDDNVTEISFSQRWIADHSVEELQELSVIYKNIKKADISEINITKFEPDIINALIKALIPAFPNLEELVIHHEANCR